MAKGMVKYYMVDAFTDSAFKGNPAAVCLLEEERDGQWMQSVAAEFNLPLTCFLTRINDSDSSIPKFRLRWFTPVIEVVICGHATLATGHTLFTTGLINSDIVEFDTLYGTLIAKKVPDVMTANDASSKILTELDFPVIPTTIFKYSEVSLLLSEALNGVSMIDIRWTGLDDLLVVVPSGKHVVEIEPQFDAIRKCPGRGIIVTGVALPDSGFDFVSRFFYLKIGVNEDHVCGSAHCSLAPYWREKLGKHDFIAYAASSRGGIVNIHLDEERQRVLLRGKAVTVMEGSLLV